MVKDEKTKCKETKKLPKTVKGPTEGQSLEHYRLAGGDPLFTLLYLSLGPILAQVTGALKGIISTIWVSQSLGELGLATISAIGVYDGISRAFGFFLSSAGSAKISQLYGEKKDEEASQVVADLMRISVICGIIVPAILGPTVEPLARWFGANDQLVVMCKQYMLPINIGTFTTVLFVGLGGCLQGEGRSLFFSLLNVISLVINMCVFDPAFLLGFKTGIWGASFGQALAEAIPAIILVILYLTGKFGVKVKGRQLISRFSKHTLPSLKVGLSQLFANLSQFIPAILIRKLIGLAAKDEFTNAMSGYNASARLAALIYSMLIALSMGFVPPASYALASKMYRRWFKLVAHLIWLSFTWGFATGIVIWAAGAPISSLFASGEGYMKYAVPMVQFGNGLAFVAGGGYDGVAMMQSLQMGIRSTIFSLLTNFLAIIIFSLILYFTNKNDAARIAWSYSLANALAFIGSIVMMIFPMKKLYKAMIESEHNSNPKDFEETQKDDSKSEKDPESQANKEDKEANLKAIEVPESSNPSSSLESYSISNSMVSNDAVDSAGERDDLEKQEEL